MPLPQEINIGTAPNNGTGDPLRTAFQKSNARDVYLDERIDNLTKITFLPTVPPTGVINTLYAERSTGLLKEWNGTDYVLYGGSGGVSKPPVDADPYTDVAALLAAQNDQEEDYFYEVTDASGFTDPDITTGNAVVLLTKTPGVDATGTEADYIVVWAKEFELGGGATYDDTDILADLATKVKKRTLKTITTTVSYTLITEDFTDFILKFTANGNEEISVVLNAGVAPLNGELQMISTGNNKLVPSLGAGVTATYPEQTNPKTILKGWLGGIVTATNTISFNGSLESTAVSSGGIEEAPSDGTPYSRQDASWVAAATGGGATLTSQLTNDGDDTINPFIDRLDTFTNTDGGTVPPPNISGSVTYGGAITFPTEGFTVTEGDTVSVTASESAVVVGASRKKLTNEGWIDDIDNRPINSIPSTTTYNVVSDDKSKHLLVSASNIVIPNNVFSEGDLLVISCNITGGSNVSGLTFGFDTVPITNDFNIKANGTIYIKFLDASTAFVWGDLPRTYVRLYSPDTSEWLLKVDNTGTITTTAV